MNKYIWDGSSKSSVEIVNAVGNLNALRGLTYWVDAFDEDPSNTLWVKVNGQFVNVYVGDTLTVEDGSVTSINA